MNYKRILIGGLVAGLTINVLDFLVMLMATGGLYEKFQAKGLFLKEPRLPFAPLWILGMFAIGILLAWFYAVARPRLGSGPGTALLVSFVLALMVHVPYNLASATWNPTGRLLPLIHMTAGIVEMVIAGYFAAWIYKEKE
ncbi:MAG TPA: hypothetical protein PK747_09130 [Acidobacteriota bacterium]|jgi:hypothetical protein|nr:hypothetical protein [Acidobacteriota bacterium]HNT18118.1 hypothetical protein [Acidobacteriota bacterium]HPA27115.1 hypothetical protein [Acidobacteriota bacterium]HQO20771.1 hypothetical protein [Acidobacteriota bacterium]HQQ47555.1 hypothetical protein [Acidobacteriota bacterium]